MDNCQQIVVICYAGLCQPRRCHRKSQAALVCLGARRCGGTRIVMFEPWPFRTSPGWMVSGGKDGAWQLHQGFDKPLVARESERAFRKQMREPNGLMKGDQSHADEFNRRFSSKAVLE